MEVDDPILEEARMKRLVTGCLLVDGTEGGFETSCLCSKCGMEATETHRSRGYCMDKDSKCSSRNAS